MTDKYPVRWTCPKCGYWFLATMPVRTTPTCNGHTPPQEMDKDGTTVTQTNWQHTVDYDVCGTLVVHAKNITQAISFFHAQLHPVVGHVRILRCVVAREYGEWQFTFDWETL